MSTKEAAIEMIRAMPDDATWAEIVAVGREKFGAVDPAEEELTQEEWDAAWAEEINRRVEEMESGKVKGVPAEEVFRKLREKYG